MAFFSRSTFLSRQAYVQEPEVRRFVTDGHIDLKRSLCVGLPGMPLALPANRRAQETTTTTIK